MSGSTGAVTGYEAELWKMAGALRGIEENLRRLGFGTPPDERSSVP